MAAPTSPEPEPERVDTSGATILSASQQVSTVPASRTLYQRRLPDSQDKKVLLNILMRSFGLGLNLESAIYHHPNHEIQNLISKQFSNCSLLVSCSIY